MNAERTRIRIVAEDREEAGGVIAELRAREDVALEVRRLPAGDFLVEERFAIERKTRRDFGQSVIDARLLAYLGRQAQEFVRGALSRPGYRPKGKRARQLFMLQGLPGVGPGRAARLLERFGSVQAVTAASATDLAAVEGFGETTAARIRWALE